MSLNQLRNVNFGKSKGFLTGTTGVGYTVLDYTGATVQARTTAGVYEISAGTGLYAAYISFPNSFHGQVLWDTGEGTFATEQFNYEENNPAVDVINATVTQMSGSLEFVREMTEGRWKIVNNQMIFYKSDNVTEVARFNLLDNNGNPTMDSPFERVRL